MAMGLVVVFSRNKLQVVFAGVKLLLGNGSRRAQTLRTVVSDATTTNRRAREDLAVSYRGLYYYGMAGGVCNHLTLRAPARNGNGEVMLLIPHGVHWSQVTASCLVGVDIPSKQVVEGEGRCNESTLCLHAAIYQAFRGNPDVKCVMHAHPPYATALCCLKDPRLKMTHQNSMRYFDKIAYDFDYEGVPDTSDEGARLARILGDKQILIMSNRGVLAVGKSAAFVFDGLYFFERAAMTQMLAQGPDTEVSEVSDRVSQGLADYQDRDGYKYIEAHFKGIKTVLAGKEPDFRS